MQVIAPPSEPNCWVAIDDTDPDGRLKIKEVGGVHGLLSMAQHLPDSLFLKIENGPDGVTHLNIYKRGPRKTARLVGSLRKDAFRAPTP